MKQRQLEAPPENVLEAAPASGITMVPTILFNEMMATIREERRFHERIEPMIYEEYLTRQEAAKILKVSDRTIDDMVKHREIPVHHLRKQLRFLRSELDAVIKSVKVRK